MPAPGPDWKYVEPATGQTFTRSEGLAVASFHAFTAGLFSSDRNQPLQADSAGLRGLVTDHLASAFQVSEHNPLVGLEERAVLLRRLGEVMSEQPEVFGEDGPARRPVRHDRSAPWARMFPHTADVTAHDILSQLLISLSGIWPASNSDQRPCRWAIAGAIRPCAGEGLTDGWMPFHKLSQWLTYSLLEPFEWSGVQVRGLEALTGLPEYRNGGLLIDSGLLRLRDEAGRQEIWQPGDEIIVEWRALTVALLDEVAHARAPAATIERSPVAAGLRTGRRHLGRRPRTGPAPSRRLAAAEGGERRHGILRLSLRADRNPCAWIEMTGSSPDDATETEQ